MLYVDNECWQSDLTSNVFSTIRCCCYNALCPHDEDKGQVIDPCIDVVQQVVPELVQVTITPNT
jgi:hypothetical protein